LLIREIFYTLKEAQIMIERWRQEYNAVRLHSALGYRSPPALLLLFLNLMITDSSLGLLIIFASVREALKTVF
jgi:Integrase core domain